MPDFDVEMTGFEAPEVDQLIAQLGADPDKEETFDVEAALADETPPVTQPGELFELGRHRLFCVDCTDANEVRRLMLGERASLFATDPPYLVDYDGMNHPSAKRDRQEKAAGQVKRTWEEHRLVGLLRHHLGRCRCQQRSVRSLHRRSDRRGVRGDVSKKNLRFSAWRRGCAQIPLLP